MFASPITKAKSWSSARPAQQKQLKSSALLPYRGKDTTTERAAVYPNAGNQALLRVLAQSASGSSSDRHEREAESAANSVLESSRDLRGLLPSPPAMGSSMGSPPSMDSTFQFQSPGKPLDHEAGSFLEARFGHNFSGVRIHDDSAAHGAAKALDARAFTLGSDVFFGADEYAPGSRAGIRLLAHELTHVLQQSRSSSPTLQRAPVLSGRTPAELIADDDFAKDVDKALAASKTITTYIAAKNLKKASGHFRIVFKETFDLRLAENAKAVGDTSVNTDNNTVTKGLTDLKAGEIYLKERLADVEGAVHEAIHLNSKQSSDKSVSSFQKAFGHPLEEGVTQYFTNKVLAEQGIGSGAAYPDQLAMAEALISVLGGESLVGKAYFGGDQAAFKAVVDAFNKSHGNYTVWRELSRSKDPKDWAKATKALKAAFGTS